MVGYMNRIQWKDFFREIKKNKGRFFSLLFIVALGCAFYSGIRSSEPDMTASVDRYFNETNFCDIRIISTLGLTDKDLDAIKEIEGVSECEGAYSCELFAKSDTDEPVLNVVSACSNLNRFTIREGRMPENDRECFVDIAYINNQNCKIGDTITLLDTDKKAPENLKRDTYTIVGYGTWAWYLNLTRGSASIGDGRIDAFLVLDPDAFTQEYYSTIFATVEGAAAENCYEDKYEEIVDAVTDRISEISDIQVLMRRNELVEDGEEKIAEARIKIADARKELDDAKKELDDGEKEYADGLAEYKDGEKELEDGRKKYNDGVAELEEGRQKYEDGKAEYESGLQKYEDGMAQYQDGASQLADGKETLKSSRKKLDESWKQLEEGEAQLAIAEDTIASKEAELYAGEELLSQKESEVAEQKEQILEQQSSLQEQKEQVEAGLVQVEAGMAAANGGIAQLTQAIAEIDGGIAQIDAGIAGIDARIQELREAEQAESPQEPSEDDKEGAEEVPAMTADYSAEIAQLEAQKGALLQSQEELRGQRAGLETQLLEAQGQLSALEGQNAELTAAYTQITGGLEQIAGGLEEIAAGESLLQAEREKLESGKKELTAGKKELGKSREKLVTSREQLEAGEKEYQAGLREIQSNEAALSSAWETLMSSSSQLADAEAQLADAKKEIEDGEAELADARKELEDGEEELTDAKKELADARKELHDGWNEYRSGKKEADEKIADAEVEIDDGEKKLKDIPDGEWYVLDRNTIQTAVEYGMDAERIGKIANVFPVIFFLVAALVSLTTMTRMIEEERMLIGTMKALGYGKLPIIAKYLIYAGSATLTGGILGVLVGSKILPFVILTAYGMLYTNVPIMLTPYHLSYCLIAIGMAMLCTVGAAFVACYRELLSTPAALMRPPAPKQGKKIILERIPFLWSRLNFSLKSTIRNLVRYKKRLFMTVFGIGGCMAVLLVSYGLHDSIAAIVDNQYQRIWTYSSSCGLDETQSEEEKLLLQKDVETEPDIQETMLVRNISLDVSTDVGTKTAYLYVVESEEVMKSFLDLHDRQTKEKYQLTDDGVILSEKLATSLDVHPGDEVTLKISDTEYRNVKVTASAENYMYNYIYMTPKLYRETYNEDPSFNELMIRYAGEFTEEEEDVLSEKLLSREGITSVSSVTSLQRTVNNMLNALNLVVWVLVIAAGLLVFVVTFNLNNINISERRRELASLKVLGFYDMEVAMYVYRENIFLTIFGIIAGLFMGTWLHRVVITTLEVEMIMFGRNITPMSYLYSSILTIVFSVMVNLLMYYKLRQIDMIESLKSVE